MHEKHSEYLQSRAVFVCFASFHIVWVRFSVKYRILMQNVP